MIFKNLRKKAEQEVARRVLVPFENFINFWGDVVSNGMNFACSAETAEKTMRFIDLYRKSL